MGRLIDDNVKKQLLDELSKEPTMVLSTAYAYAKNYVNYGEDITKAWATAAEQESILQKVRSKAWIVAYDGFMEDYEARLKADMVAMLEDLKQEIDMMPKYYPYTNHTIWFIDGDVFKLIQQKINNIKETGDATDRC